MKSGQAALYQKKKNQMPHCILNPPYVGMVGLSENDKLGIILKL